MSSSLLTHTVPAGPLRQRADKVLAAAFPEHSRVALQRAFDAGHVRLAGVVISRDHSVHPGDFLELDFPDVKPAELRPVKIPLSVLFEDRHLLVLNKAAGYFRSELAKRHKMRTTPKPRFHYDELMERGPRLESLIEKAVREDAAHAAHAVGGSAEAGEPGGSHDQA